MTQLRTMAGALGIVGVSLFMLAQLTFWLGTSMGIVREHCVDINATTPAEAAIETKWTFILWPPLFLANIDPFGGCVRNSPLREGLNAVGIWDLPPAKTQVREHLLEQVRQDSNTNP